MKSHTITGLGIFTTTVLAASRTSAPEGCVTVPDDFSSIQAAVDSGPECIFIQPGTYQEQVLVASGAGALSVYGYTEDDTSYASNTVHVVQSKGANEGYSNDETATLRVKADGFKLYNVDVENSFGEGSQAVALSAYSDSGFYGSRFIGYQDTVLANEGYQIYLDSEITGATDYIFGHRAVAWFDRCDLRCVDRATGYVTGTCTPSLMFSMTCTDNAQPTAARRTTSRGMSSTTAPSPPPRASPSTRARTTSAAPGASTPASPSSAQA